MTGTLIEELRGWREMPGMSDDARRKLYLMRLAADGLAEAETVIAEARALVAYLGPWREDYTADEPQAAMYDRLVKSIQRAMGKLEIAHDE